jgi:multicomponent Na+:H+ antiporter subunit G
MTPTEISVLAIATIGVFFMLVSAIGILRLPDIFARMHAAGKAATLGVSCLLLASGVFFGAQWFWRAVLLIFLFFVTAPIATTTMARAAYRARLSQRFVLKHDDMAREYQDTAGAEEMEISRTTPPS